MHNILEDMTKCYGCSSCKNICPTNAIKMIENPEGFIEPVVNEQKCIDCNACQRSCPALTAEYNNSDTPEVVAFQADKDTLARGSSGGAFPLLASYVLKESGVVFGASFTDDWMVEHIGVKTEEGLKKLAFSKYLQSDIKNTFNEAKDYLVAGRKVLYVGCPCQIAGFKSFLGRSYDNLITIDLICHGVPSPGSFRDYLKENFNTEKIKSISFRSGTRWRTILGIDFTDGSREEYNTKNNLYLRTFLQDCNLRTTCYSCIFAKLPRQGDITIGDLWNAEKMELDMPKGKTSVVLCNNNKGSAFFYKAVTFNKEKCLVQSVRLDNKRLNKNIFRSTLGDNKLSYREQFFSSYSKQGFSRAAYEATSNFKTGLVLYLSSNYGSMATNLSLYEFLRKNGMAPVFCDNLIKPLGKYAPLFAKKYLKCATDYFRDNDYEELNKYLDTFVVGADMTWNLKTPGMKKRPEYVLLGFADDNKTKLAYTPSFGGGGTEMPEEKRIICSYFMKRFDRIAVREPEGKEICEKLFGCEVEVEMDPFFLSDAELYSNIADTANMDNSSDYLLAYILNPSNEKNELINKVATELNLNINIVLDLAGDQDDLKQKLGQLANTVVFPNFAEWLALFKNAKYIVTDSYHGVCLALKFNKQFLGIRNRAKYRFDSLSKQFPLGMHIFDIKNIDIEHFKVDNKIDYTEVSKTLDQIKKKGEQWFEPFITKSKSTTSSFERHNSEAYDISMHYVALLHKSEM